MSIYYLYPPPSRYPTTSIRGHAFPTTATTAATATGSHHHPTNHHNNPLQPLLHVLHDLAHPAIAAHDVRAPAADIRETAARYYIDVELPGVAPGDYSVRWTDENGGGNGGLLLVEAELRRRRVPEEEEEEEEENRQEGEEGGPEETLGGSLHRVRSHDGDDLYAVVSSGSDDDDDHEGAPPATRVLPPVTLAKKERTQSLSAAWTAATAVRPRAFLLHHAATTGPSHETASTTPSHSTSSSPKKQQHQHQHQADPNPRVRSLARERRIGTFARAFRFHAAVDQAGLQVRLEQGVLSLVVPKKQEEDVGKKTTSKGVGVDSVAVRRRRTAAAAVPEDGKEAGGDSGSGRRGSFSILHGAHHHWTLAWPGPARNRVVGPQQWSPGLMSSPGFFM